MLKAQKLVDTFLIDRRLTHTQLTHASVADTICIHCKATECLAKLGKWLDPLKLLWLVDNVPLRQTKIKLSKESSLKIIAPKYLFRFVDIMNWIKEVALCFFQATCWNENNKLTSAHQHITSKKPHEHDKTEMWYDFE